MDKVLPEGKLYLQHKYPVMKYNLNGKGEIGKLSIN